MSRHRFDPLSFALGVLAIGTAVFVISGTLPDDDGAAGWWLALGALVLGLGLIPWSRRRASPADEDAPG